MSTDNAMQFSFGDPTPVLSNTLTDYLGVFLDVQHEYYSPPVSLSGLGKILRANAHHGTIPYFRRNMLLKYFSQNSALRANDLGKAGFDYDVFANCYFKAIKNRLGQILRLEHLPAINMRRMKDRDRFCMLQPSGKPPVIFQAGEVIHLKEYDPLQEIYGIPQYIGGINSVLLNESSTLFRIKYYVNGAHMGYVFYTADAKLDKPDEDALKQQIRDSKGVGNFRSMYINIPGGKPDSVKIIPVGDFSTKDEFEKIKSITRSDIISMWRVPPALAGIMPDNAGGFGDIEKITNVYYENEVIPTQQVFLQLNEYLPQKHKIRFEIKTH